jgi:hypothetical protein
MMRATSDLHSLDAATTLEAISAVLEEDLSGAVPDSSPGLDTHYSQLKTSAMGVYGEFGRDMKVLHPFTQGVAGTVKWVSGVTGPAPIQGLEQTVARTAANVQKYPGLAENIVPGHNTKVITLARAKGNVFIPIEYGKADASSHAIVSSVKEIIRGTARNILLSEIHQYYRQTFTDAQGIAKIGTTPTIADLNATNDKITFVVAGGSIRNFYPGMLIDFHAASGAARRNTGGPIVVDQVRYVPDLSNDTGGWGQVVAASPSGENLSVAGVVSGDAIVRVDSEGNGPLGPEDWMVTSGTIFGINYSTFPQFQSIVRAVSGVATPTYLNKIFGQFFVAYGMENMADTLVTGIGVTNAVVEQNDGLQRFQGGAPLQFVEGYEMGEIPYRFNGRNMLWINSAFMPSLSDMTADTQTGGRLWALKTREQNLMRYVPAKRAGAGTGDDPITSEVEFVMTQPGMGVFKARHDADGDTVNFYEAPFDRWMAIAPKFLPGVRLTGVTESIK